MAAYTSITEILRT